MQTIERVSYRLDEVANASGLSISSIRKYVREGQLPARHLGGRVVVLASDFKTFLANLAPVKAA